MSRALFLAVCLAGPALVAGPARGAVLVAAPARGAMIGAPVRGTLAAPVKVPRAQPAKADTTKPVQPVPLQQPLQAAPALPAQRPPQAAPAVPLQKPPPPPAIPPRRFGSFDLDMPFAAFRAMPELRDCTAALAPPSGHADCALPHDADKLSRVQVAWEDGKNAPEIVALRLVFDPQLAPALTDLEWQLTRGWGPPVLEQLRREHETKYFTLEWEDAEHRATLEAQGPFSQPSRAVAVIIERKQLPLSGEFAALHPRPFPGFRIRWIRRIDYEGLPHALVWGTSLTPAQQAVGEQSAAFESQRNYVGLWRLEPATAARPRRWRPLWERTTGGDEEEDEPQRILHVQAKDVTNDGSADIEVELTCDTCGQTTDELIVKTVRAGKLVDLLSKR
ncbi:MAG TPA: hypothetical protein VGH20_00165, partial [Myxococcales bacterium]